MILVAEKGSLIQWKDINVTNSLLFNYGIHFFTQKIPCFRDGWMTCDFTSFSTVFQVYQDDGQMIMKGCVQWNSVYG